VYSSTRFDGGGAAGIGVGAAAGTGVDAAAGSGGGLLQLTSAVSTSPTPAVIALIGIRSHGLDPA
jgi:hypothetical protein